MGGGIGGGFGGQSRQGIFGARQQMMGYGPAYQQPYQQQGYYDEQGYFHQGQGMAPQQQGGPGMGRGYGMAPGIGGLGGMGGGLDGLVGAILGTGLGGASDSIKRILKKVSCINLQMQISELTSRVPERLVFDDCQYADE